MKDSWKTVRMLAYVVMRLAETEKGIGILARNEKVFVAGRGLDAMDSSFSMSGLTSI